MNKLGSYITKLMTTVLDNEQEQFVKDLALSELRRLNVDMEEFIRKHTMSVEDEIENIEKQINTLSNQLSDPDFYLNDPDGFLLASENLAIARSELEKYELRWLELEELKTD